MKYDLTIERHQVIKAADENGWGRNGAPYFDLWHRGDREVQVFYFADGTVNSAQCIDQRTKATATATTADGLVAQVLRWLETP